MKQDSNVKDRTVTKTWQKWLPAVFLVALLAVFTVGAVVGVRALLPTREAPQAEPPKPLEVEEYVPAEVDEFGNPIPQRVPVDIGIYPSEGGQCSTLSLPRANPFCDNLSDRALTDSHVADYVAAMAADQIAAGSPGAIPLTQDRVHWLRQVVATPVEDGGPDLKYEAEFLDILDGWFDGHYSNADKDWQWARSLLDGGL